LPSLALFATTSPQLLSAALAVASPHVPPPAPESALMLAPVGWSLAAAQDIGAPPTTDADPPAPPSTEPSSEEGEEGEVINEIVVQGEYGPPKSDPIEFINEESYRLTQAIDGVVVKPLAYAYRDAVPEPIRDGLGNLVRNLGEPNNALNFLLQGKVGKALGALGRLAINSTVGIGGLIDVAGKPGIGIPYRRNGFGNTMGYYGIGQGPYLFVPINGPTTARDQLGVILDQAFLPYLAGKPFNQPPYAISYLVINGLDTRLRDDAEIAEIAASDDPYVARRESYLAKREREIAALKGETVPEAEEEGENGSTNAAQPLSDLTLPERLQLTGQAAPEGR
jgi:phospholipid-binding lipoprotein MlaA